MNTLEATTDEIAESLGDDVAASVLIVDDRKENLLALESALDGLARHVVKAGTGREALRQALEQDFAVILLDVRLPEMSGFETASLLRSRERTRHTPIIFLTAIDKDDKQVSQGYELGAVDYIFKPADPDILRAKVSVFLDLYRKTKQIEVLNRSLEQRVRQRTEELEAANLELEREVHERQRAEAEIRALNAELEERVRARTAELESANEELRAFSYSVSHDLRAPLRKIESFCQILHDEYEGVLDETAEGYLERIRANSERMSALIDEILKLSRISRESMALVEVDLSDVAREVIEELKQEEPGRQVEVYIEDGLRAMGDRALLRVVMDNLISNAWKFTSRRDDARIDFRRIPDERRDVFALSDNGAGFRMEDAKKLFQPFQRLHPAHAFPGTGIGLAIVNRIMRRHGGEIAANGKEDEGATFTISLPKR